MSRAKREHAGGLFDKPVHLLSFTAALLAIGWIVFVGSVHLHEMILGAVIVAMCTAFCGQIFSSATLPLDLRWRDLAQIWRVPGAVIKDFGVLTVVLLRDLFGGRRAESLYGVCGFRSSRRDPVLIARSALAITYTTVSPNMIVIGIDPAQSHMLFHQVGRDPVSKMTRALGAGQ